MWYYLFADKNIPNKLRLAPMGMITQDEVNIQEIQEAVLHNIPAIITRNGKAFILVKDINDGLEEYINTGKTNAGVIGVFPDKHEKELADGWSANGYECIYHQQTLECMHRRVSVRYPTIRNPRTGMGVSLLPWCMLPERPYPVFLYAYADWHYLKTGQKSMKMSAHAAGKVFGVSSFNKSTLCRMRRDKSITGMPVGGTQSTIVHSARRDADIAACVTGLLEHPAPTQNIAGTDGGGRRPPTNNTEFNMHALSAVPDELSKVIIGGPPTRHIAHDKRKRPPRPRHMNNAKRVQRPVRYVNSDRIEYIRIEFIALCKAAVIDAAIKYHRFLI